MAKKTKKRKAGMIAGAIIILLGVGLLLYPTVANKWNNMHATKAIASYMDTVTNMTEDNYDKMWADARVYNESLVNKESRFEPTEEEHALYESLLDVTGTGIMGYVEIPCIKVKLPIYHTTDETVLQIAAGHLEGSSLPIGGPSTHAAISGHTGMTSAKLFTALEKMKIGDTFFIHVLNTTLEYEVDQIDVVLPDETDILHIEEGEDYLTLITCTPYGVNSHRLLVRGSRTEYIPIAEENEIQEVPTEAEAKDFELPSVFVILTFVVAFFMIFGVISLVSYYGGEKGKHQK